MLNGSTLVVIFVVFHFILDHLYKLKLPLKELDAPLNEPLLSLPKYYFIFIPVKLTYMHYSSMTIFPKCSMKIRPNEKSTISNPVQMQRVSIFSLVSGGNKNIGFRVSLKVIFKGKLQLLISIRDIL